MIQKSNTTLTLTILKKTIKKNLPAKWKSGKSCKGPWLFGFECFLPTFVFHCTDVVTESIRKLSFCTVFVTEFVVTELIDLLSAFNILLWIDLW